MRKLRLLLLGIAVLLAVGTTGAAAAPPTSAAGTYTYTDSYFESFRVSGNNVIIELVAAVEYTGTLVGTSEVRGTIVVHADGSANFRDVEVFTGTVDGVPGTITFRLAGSNDPSLNVRATSTIVSATGDLAGLHGTLGLRGSVRFPEGPYGTYTGTIGSRPTAPE
jgi:Protein of unknown function (DUF3224)